MRRGLIKMTEEFYTHNWDDFALVLKDFKLTHIEHRHWDGGLWYFFGTSDFFDENIEGAATPEYMIIFTRDEDEEITYKFKKVS